MDKIKWKLQNMMHGRNGMDELGRAILIGSAAILLVSGAARWRLLYDIAVVGLFWELYRCFSKRISERKSENEKYLRFLSLNKMRFEMRKEYKIFRCKGCGRNIRVPRKKGKIEVTCPVCGTKTIHRT